MYNKLIYIFIEKLDTNKHIKKENIKKTNIQSMSSKSCMMPEFKVSFYFIWHFDLLNLFH